MRWDITSYLIPIQKYKGLAPEITPHISLTKNIWRKTSIEDVDTADVLIMLLPILTSTIWSPNTFLLA